MPESRSSDLFPRIFQVLALAALVATSLWIIRPFLVALIWATTVAIATWPILLRVQRTLGGKRALAVAVMTIALLLVFLIPLYLMITIVAANVERISDLPKSLSNIALAGPPSWVRAIPIVGSKVAVRWQELASAGPAEVSARLTPFVHSLAIWFLTQTGNFGVLFLQFMLTVVIAAILYARGEIAASGVLRFARRLAGPEGEKIVLLAAQSVKGVALGIVITAVVQALLAGIGLGIARVPFPGLLTGLIFILAIAQIGPGPVLIGAVIWVYYQSGPVWGTSLLLWSIFCSTFDNFMRPLLIKRGADLPILLVFAGVIGGLFSFGVIGLFIGPVVLAVAYTLLTDWVSESEIPSASSNSA
jgi:predicted PurR-regulated permease PerM